jgi:hypothetical protein
VEFSKEVAPMSEILDQPVFAAGEAQYTWADVVLAARAWGDRRNLIEHTRLGIACARHARRTGQLWDSAAAEAAAEGFREDRELFEADDMEAWLETRGIDADDWMRYIRRVLLREKFRAELADIRAKCPVSRKEVGERLWAEGVCSGEWDRLAWKLAGRAAVHDRTVKEGGASKATIAPLPDWDPGNGIVAGVRPEIAQARLPVLESLEQSFQAFRRQVTTPDAVRAQITAHQTDWVQVVCASVVFPDEGMAKEAALCIRDDGEPLEEVAARARAVVQERRFALEEIPPAQRMAFLSAQKGDLLGPLNWDGFRLIQLRDKVLPSPDDPATRQRAEQAVLEVALGREIRQRIKWVGKWQAARGTQSIS